MEFTRSNEVISSRRERNRRGGGSIRGVSGYFATQPHQEESSSSGGRRVDSANQLHREANPSVEDQGKIDAAERIKTKNLIRDLLILRCWTNSCMQHIQDREHSAVDKKYLRKAQDFQDKISEAESLLEPLKQAAIRLESGKSYQDEDICRPINNARQAFDNLKRQESAFRNHLRLVGMLKDLVDIFHQRLVQHIKQQGI